ncbi:MAG: quinoprotein relay system zinc metallohydrolase 1 [Zoogloea sp.]|nr:quinoprotein relay system zinc metallohydrolase 1 [Zoogloea sp.]
MRLVRSLFACFAIGLATLACAADFDYRLTPRQLAPDTWVLVGRSEDFSVANGANIVNTAFIVTRDGVVVIDTGPSLRYGEAMRQAIARITDRPVVLTLNTHHHPDHFLGNQAFPAASLQALPDTVRGIASEGNAFAENMYRMAGDWLSGTEVVVPGHTAAPGVHEIGGHKLEFLALDGHTGADLAVFDHTTGVLFAGDLVFHDRAPTTPHARIPHWLASLDKLEALPFKLLVPGHGAPAADAGPIVQTRAWLVWLSASLKESAEAGLDMTEAMARPLPPAFRDMPLAGTEYRRSVTHLYPAAEEAALEHGHAH